jgi:hypothetical protein
MMEKIDLRRAKDVEKQYDSFGPLFPVEGALALLA